MGSPRASRAAARLGSPAPEEDPKLQPTVVAVLDLLQSQPPSRLRETLGKAVKLRPDKVDEFMSQVTQPLRSEVCAETGREFIVCDHNRDGQSFRSPWSNRYQPDHPDGDVPSVRLRGMEEVANDTFDAYARAYYGSGALVSCYFWDIEDELGFGAAVAIRKEVREGHVSGVWNSVHVFAVEEMEKALHSFTYSLSSTVSLTINTKDRSDRSCVSGTRSLNRVETLPSTSDDDHLGNIGDMVQAHENQLREKIDLVQVGKAADITGVLRSRTLLGARALEKEVAAQIRKTPQSPTASPA
eukprot:TRINITY_DN36073_c0_g1_i1.p1 TRINITY_DN36073_c0_g1~~TRINITY_DN36073_c0_g1_i1.p1  ORF type:complete len:316 (+),score=63.29 TRINITY_DN36073_c0_g1_i1:52-948(+)